MKHEYSFGIIPIFKNETDPQLLLIQHQAGHWAFPKGHAEVGESPLQTAQRELEEETGLKAYRIDEAHIFTEEYHVTLDGISVPKTVQYFPAFVANQTVVYQESEVQDFGWFSYQEALERVTFDVTKKLLADLKEYLARL